MIVSLQEAREEGTARYYLGTPCSRGHIAERFTSSRACVVCQSEAVKRFARTEQARAARRRRQSAAYTKDASRIKKKNKDQYAKNRAARILWQADWQRRNPDSVAARNSKRRSAAGSESYTPADVSELMTYQSGRCFWCNQPFSKRFHVDHVMPLSRGGSNTAGNIVLACAPCNHSKGSKPPIQWILEIYNTPLFQQAIDA